MTLDWNRLKTIGANLAAYAASEAASKVTRLLAVIALARFLTPVEIGLAAVALAVGDIMKSLTDNGVGQRIVAAEDDELDAVCNRARQLYWWWCVGLFTLQCAIGAVIYWLDPDMIILLMIVMLAGQYLFIPYGQVQCFLAMREGRLKQTAAIGATQTALSNILTAVLVAVWPTPVAAIAPKLMTAPLWTLLVRRLRPWSKKPEAGLSPIRPFLTFGGSILGVEFLRAMRLQADKLIIGALLGAETLGIYFFAFNAGLGVATSFTVAFSIVLFPTLAAERKGKDRAAAFRAALLLALCVIAPVVAFQALMAPWYVPLIFGADWAHTAPIVSLLCFAAIPAVIWTAVSQWLRAHDQAHIELMISACLTAALMAGAAISAQFGLMAVAWSYLGVATAIQIGSAVWVLWQAGLLRPSRTGEA
ncbi:MAG: oligosaccharide flippase family protein [Pseudomonadota bacterium]